MPDWLDVNLAQTVLLVAATVLAWLTFQGERDARRDAAIERRLNHIAERVVELGAAATRAANMPGQHDMFLVAQRNLSAALAIAPANAKLVRTKVLLRWNVADLDRSPTRIDDAVTEIEADLRRLTS